MASASTPPPRPPITSNPEESRRKTTSWTDPRLQRTADCPSGSGGDPSRRIAGLKTPPPPSTAALARRRVTMAVTGSGGSRRSSLERPVSLPHGEKTVYFIRHGQSTANVTPTDARRRDSSLVDCGLTRRGIDQSLLIPECLTQSGVESVELVIASPLTRALTTAVLAFPKKPILVHYDLGEFGGIVGSLSGSSAAKQKVLPENIPRPIETVVRELEEQCQQLGIEAWDPALLDTTSLRPQGWPTSRHVDAPAVVKRDKVCQFVRDFLARRPESVVAVVAHSRVIQAALSVSSNPCCFSNGTPGSLARRRGPHQHATPRKGEAEGGAGNPRNAVPIACRLTSRGIERIEAPSATPRRGDEHDEAIQPILGAPSPRLDSILSPTLDGDDDNAAAQRTLVTLIACGERDDQATLGTTALPTPISLASRLEDEAR